MCHRVVGPCGEPGGYAGWPGLVVGAAAADRVSQRSHQGEGYADDEDDDADGRQERQIQEESGDEKNESDNDHGVQQLSV